MAVGGSRLAAGMRTGLRCASVAAVVLLSTAVAGCSSRAPTCQPTGSALHITAQGTAFDTNCLAALAGEPFSIAFDNKDAGVPHNVLISIAFAPGSPVIFDGHPVKGPRAVTYLVRSLKPGTYSFECSLHPGQMHGTFIVGSAGTPSTGT